MLFLIITIILLNSCDLNNFSKEIKETKHHIMSSDKKVIIYQENFKDGEKNMISLLTWINQKGSYGGTGVLNMSVPKSTNLKMLWLNDSLLSVKIPKHAIITNKKSSSYFYGRKINFKYSTKQ